MYSPSLDEQEDGLGVEGLAAAPDGQRATQTIVLACQRDHVAIDRDGLADAANGLTGSGRDMLDERHATSEIAPLGEEPSNCFRRHRDDEIGHRKPVDRLHDVEADRHARRGVPDERRRHGRDRW